MARHAPMPGERGGDNASMVASAQLLGDDQMVGRGATAAPFAKEHPLQRRFVNALVPQEFDSIAPAMGTYQFDRMVQMAKLLDVVPSIRIDGPHDTPPCAWQSRLDLEVVSNEPQSTYPANAIHVQRGSALRTYQTSTLRMLQRLGFYIAPAGKRPVLPRACAGPRHAPCNEGQRFSKRQAVATRVARVRPAADVVFLVARPPRTPNRRAVLSMRGIGWCAMTVTWWCDQGMRDAEGRECVLAERPLCQAPAGRHVAPARRWVVVRALAASVCGRPRLQTGGKSAAIVRTRRAFACVTRAERSCAPARSNRVFLRRQVDACDALAARCSWRWIKHGVLACDRARPHQTMHWGVASGPGYMATFLGMTGSCRKCASGCDAIWAMSVDC